MKIKLTDAEQAEECRREFTHDPDGYSNRVWGKDEETNNRWQCTCPTCHWYRRGWLSCYHKHDERPNYVPYIKTR